MYRALFSQCLGPNLTRSSSLYSASQSFTSISHSAKFSSIRPWNCGTCPSSLRSTVADIALDLSSATNVNFSIQNCRVSRSINGSAMTSHEMENTQLVHDTSGPTRVNTKWQHGLSRKANNYTSFKNTSAQRDIHLRWCIFATHATLRTFRFTLLKNFLAYDSSHQLPIHS